IAALAIGALLVVPIWRIDLAAPQYPEGLALQIFHDRFTGDVGKINGLNHYIGMATIHNEMFPEFAIMRYAFYLLIGWGIVAAAIGRRGALFSWIMVLFAYMIWAIWDMYAWGYKYGHDLDPHAAIKVEGMAYQPPLIGHKKLLNFDAWSLPDTGGWLLFGVITMACIIWFIEWRWPRTDERNRMASAARHIPAAAHVLALVALVSMSSCTNTTRPTIEYGKVECSFCRMNVMDREFASAIVTHQGRTYAFDSPECMVDHVAKGNIAEAQVKGWWVCDHVHPGRLIDATRAFYLHSDAMRSPMNGNTAAFASSADRQAAIATAGGDPLDWSGARTLLTSP
ncbi:MAG TPA: nitrous oxide reductase accessory protein NosL, partial [Flavobacteriales bacterium]|nr:nitrous oxide reductase accessory protein NosL [Flavobacteriales bacterium]